MNSSVVNDVNKLHTSLESVHHTLHLSDLNAHSQTNKVQTKTNILGVSHLTKLKDFDYSFPTHKLGKISGKKRSIDVSTDAVPNLLDQIKSKFAFLLQKQDDGTYCIDTTELNGIKQRKKYLPIGCKIELNKDLTEITSLIPDGSIPPGSWEQIALISINIFIYLYNAVVTIYHMIVPETTKYVRNLPTDSKLKKVLWPFQQGSPQFSDKIDNFLLADHGLLYHMFGFEHNSLVQYLKHKIELFEHKLPSFILLQNEIASDSQIVMNLPLIQIAQQYWTGMEQFVVDMLNKGILVESEILDFAKHLKLPQTWSAVTALVYLLWNSTFMNAVVKDCASLFEKTGTYISKEHKTIDHAVAEVCQALIKLLSLASSKLTACAEYFECPALARKMISVNQYIVNTHPNGEFDHLKPSKVSISIV